MPHKYLNCREAEILESRMAWKPGNSEAQPLSIFFTRLNNGCGGPQSGDKTRASLTVSGLPANRKASRNKNGDPLLIMVGLYQGLYKLQIISVFTL